MPPVAPAPSGLLLSRHGQLLACLARDPGLRLRDLALGVGVTERAVQKLLDELEAAGLLSRRRVGRRNRYELHPARAIAAPLAGAVTLGEVLSVLGAERPGA